MRLQPTQPKDPRIRSDEEKFHTIDCWMYTSIFTSLQYSNRLKVLIGILFTGVLFSLADYVIPTLGYTSYDKTDFSVLIPICVVIFYAFCHLGSARWHQYIVHPILCLILGYSYASILKMIFPIDLEFFRFSVLLAGGFLLFSCFTRKVYTLPMYLFNASVSLICSFYLSYILSYVLTGMKILPYETSYSGLAIFILYLFHFICGYRHRFTIPAGIISFFVSGVATYIFYSIWAKQPFSMDALLHTLVGGFIFTACYAICSSIATIYCHQPKAHVFLPPPPLEKYTAYDQGYDDGRYEGEQDGYEKGLRDAERQNY